MFIEATFHLIPPPPTATPTPTMTATSTPSATPTATATSSPTPTVVPSQPPSGQVWTQYYLAGGQRIAMRIRSGASNDLYYLLGDHLGSTALTITEDGSLLGEMRYKAWGEARFAWGSTSTEYRYTGQRQDTDIGLYYYRARWYDPVVGRFAQADTIVPGGGNPAAWDRYAYGLDNPVKYPDPTGHWADEGCNGSSVCNLPPLNHLDVPNDDERNPVAAQVADALTYLALGMDFVGVFLADVEMITADMEGGLLIAGGCRDPRSCAATLLLGIAVDITISGASVLAWPENLAGVGAFLSTLTADVLRGNTATTSVGFIIGRDTLVSGRNMALGFIPESNFDAAVSNSQLKYDIDRLVGNKPGGSIPWRDRSEFVRQVLLKDWW